MTKFVLEFKYIENDDKTKCYSNSKAETSINESDINDLFEWIYGTIVSNIQKSLGIGLGCITDSAIDNINLSK